MNTILSYIVYFLLFIFAATIVPATAFYARCLSSYLCLVLCACYGVLVSIALRPFGRHLITQWTVARAFKYTMLLSTGVEFKIVSGSQYLTTRPAVLISNHQTELDVLLLGSIFPPYCSVTAKKSLARIPFLGWFMQLSGTVFIDRANRETAFKAFEGAAEEMQRLRQSVFIFPEGTRSYATEPRMLPFKKGAFHLAVKAGVPVVPIVAENYCDLLSLKERRFKAGVIRVKVLAPIPTTGLTSANVDDLTRDTRDLMLKALVDLSKEKNDAKTVGDQSGEARASGIVPPPSSPSKNGS